MSALFDEPSVYIRSAAGGGSAPHWSYKEEFAGACLDNNIHFGFLFQGPPGGPSLNPSPVTLNSNKPECLLN